MSLEDYKGKSGQVRVEVPLAKATDANAKKLADHLKTHSDARVTSYGISKDYAGDSVDAGKYDRCLQRLEFLYEDQDGRSRKFSYPAPRDEDVNVDQEPDSDVAEDTKDLLVSIGAITSWVYGGGGLRSRLPKRGARSTATTGV